MNWPERVWIYSPLRVFFQRREVNRWLRLKGVLPRGNALEIGCGLGRGAKLLVEKMGFTTVTAFDIEPPLVQRAARKLSARYESSIFFHVADAQDLPFRDGRFDAVVNFGIIHHVLDWKRCIAEIGRVLRPGGLFFFEEIYPPLYANFLLRRMLRHPVENRFREPEYLDALSACSLDLLEGVRTGSRFGIVGAAAKR